MKGRKRKKIPKVYAIAMKAKLGITRDQFRELTRVLKAQEIDIENESPQREYQKTIIPGDINVDSYKFLLKNEHKQSLHLSAPEVFIKDLKTYLFQILHQHKDQNRLTWHKNCIPADEIWVKIGGDHEKGSLKAPVQILNIKKNKFKIPHFIFCNSTSSRQWLHTT